MRKIKPLAVPPAATDVELSRDASGALVRTKRTSIPAAPAAPAPAPAAPVAKPAKPAAPKPAPKKAAAPVPVAAQVPANAKREVERHGLDRYAPILTDGTSPLVTVDGEKCRTQLRFKPRRDGMANYADQYLIDHFRTRYGAKTFRRGALDAGRLNRLIDREFVAVSDKGKDIRSTDPEFRPCDPDQLFRVVPKVVIRATR